MTVLVTGFGAFPGVERNPTEALARQVDGAYIDGVPVAGRVLPVSYRRGPQLAIELAREMGARLVVGLGVAVGRARVEVECVGRRGNGGKPDVDGEVDAGLRGAERVPATLDTACLADALGAGLSRNAGLYVCNAWLYQVAGALDVPVGFVHIPPTGLPPERLLRGLRALLRG
jgi:pyroglutamyl-peptidase